MLRIYKSEVQSEKTNVGISILIALKPQEWMCHLGNENSKEGEEIQGLSSGAFQYVEVGNGG